MRPLRKDDGFTVIELALIVVVMGVLAAMTLPSVLRQVDGATDARAKSAVSIAEQAIEAFWTERDTYDATAVELRGIDAGLADVENLTVVGGDRTFTVSVDSGRGATFTVERNAVSRLHSCTPAGQGGCRADGTW